VSRLPEVPRSHDRVVAGVAAGWADRWRVEPTVVRAALGLLTLVGGLGVVLYGIAALTSTAPGATPVPDPRTDLDPPVRRHLAIAAATAAILVAARDIGLWPGDGIMVPAAAVAVGVAVAWTRLPGVVQLSRRAWLSRVVQVVAGIGLLVAGVVSLASRTGGLANVGASAGAIAVVVGGLLMFAAPAAGRLLRTLDDERSARIRDEERAAVAAHLHDSVLQSLVLIQRSDDPRRMAQLARRQERELRAWLYGVGRVGEPASLHAAIEAMTVEIEADHDVRVEAVVVGDQPLDEASRTLVAAVREAVVNAARHAGVQRVDVFVEADSGELTGYVRDTGKGFDPAAVPGDRRGISDSIIGRVQRAGGVTLLHSQPGAGTEVEVKVPRR
jgi:signal transduction histidine kinase/phage shock protein PspC (stress-responsive transcriptional regulator)